MISPFPKIFALGTIYIKDIFDGNVEVTEKVDGSQFAFGMINGELHMRSKGAVLYETAPQKMFQNAIDYVVSIKGKLPDNRVFYCEYLQKPKHNALKYDKIPTNHLSLFGVNIFNTHEFLSSAEIDEYSYLLGIDRVPVVFKGETTPENVFNMIQNQSYLGGCEMEGVVVKNYAKQFLLGGQPIPIMSGKYVSERFKEVHKSSWDKQKGKNRLEEFMESFRTEARWEKAIQHKAEKGELTDSPKDIGSLIEEIGRDIFEEEADAIKEYLFNEFQRQIKAHAVKGFPEYYKKKLFLGDTNGN